MFNLEDEIVTIAGFMDTMGSVPSSLPFIRTECTNASSSVAVTKIKSPASLPTDIFSSLYNFCIDLKYLSNEFFCTHNVLYKLYDKCKGKKKSDLPKE